MQIIVSNKYIYPFHTIVFAFIITSVNFATDFDPISSPYKSRTINRGYSTTINRDQ